jgi:hypothetical protein
MNEKKVKPIDSNNFIFRLDRRFLGLYYFVANMVATIADTVISARYNAP